MEQKKGMTAPARMSYQIKVMNTIVNEKAILTMELIRTMRMSVIYTIEFSNFRNNISASRHKESLLFPSVQKIKYRNQTYFKINL